MSIEMSPAIRRTMAISVVEDYQALTDRQCYTHDATAIANM